MGTGIEETKRAVPQEPRNRNDGLDFPKSYCSWWGTAVVEWTFGNGGRIEIFTRGFGVLVPCYPVRIMGDASRTVYGGYCTPANSPNRGGQESFDAGTGRGSVVWVLGVLSQSYEDTCKKRGQMVSFSFVV